MEYVDSLSSVRMIVALGSIDISSYVRSTMVKSNCAKLNPTVSWMRAVFKELDSLIRKFVKRDGEPPYWNNEAASVSLVAAAASRKGLLALSDYRRSKEHGGKTKGRCDLYVSRGEKYLEVEAKQTYVSDRSTIKRLRTELGKARQAANGLWWTNKSNRAGLLFAVFGLSEKQAKTFDPTKLISQLKSLKADLIWFWYDTDACQGTYRFRLRGNNRYYPGVIVLIKH
jgi:hypothetical protein